VCGASRFPKRIDVLLDALARVAVKALAFRCIIVGGGLADALSSQCTRLGLSSRVSFVGHAEDVRPYLEAADCLVLSSENDGFPLALTEAMASGLPCIATNAGGNAEAVVHGSTGSIVSRNSTGELAGAIEYLLVHREERRTIGANDASIGPPKTAASGQRSNARQYAATHCGSTRTWSSVHTMYSPLALSNH